MNLIHEIEQISASDLRGRNRALDDRVMTALYGEPKPSGNSGSPKVMHWFISGGWFSINVSYEFTTDLESARRVVPKDHNWMVMAESDEITFACVWPRGSDRSPLFEARAATPAAALLCAALKARQ